MSGGSKQALEGSRLNAFLMDPDALMIVGLDTDDGVEHTLYDERTLDPIDESLVKNMMVYGNIEPVIVRKDGVRVEVVDGRQRVRAAREANKRLLREGATPINVKVMLEKGGDERMIAVMISANEQRRDDGPMVKAKKLERFLGLGHTKDEASVVFGVTTKAIEHWEKLMDLDKTVQEAVNSGKLSAFAAAELADLPKKEQKDKLAEILASGGKVTAVRIRKARAEGADKPKVKIPGRTVLRKVVASPKADGLSAPVLLALRWALGEIPASEVPGLEEALKAKKAKVVEPKAKKD
jgi:ParB family chromosome partitioning protein